MYYTPPEKRTARKPHRCTYCAEQIDVGAQYERWMSVSDGKASTNKMHPECLTYLQEDSEGGYFEYCPYEGERPPTTLKKGRHDGPR